MSANQLVSILVPAYNKEGWIEDTIKSALAQTWQNKELIIVDDGSKDRTLDVIRRFESSAVKVVAQENQGACAARNKAYTLAQGAYIQWLDADDLLHPQKIETQMKGIPDGTRERCLRTAAFGSFYFRRSKAQFCPTGLWQDLSPSEWMITKFTERAWLNPTSWLVSRTVSDLAGNWDARLSPSGADDGEYICRLVTKVDRVEFVPDSKCYYRIGNLSSLNHNSERALGSLLLALTLCIRHLLSIDDSPRAKKAGLQYLQDWFPLFYSGPTALVAEMENFASSLGGQLQEPPFSWKYAPIRRVLGWQAANAACKYLRSRRMLTEKALDEFLYMSSTYWKSLRRA
jgi:glycosyltransferase involved in cell wall biosynthesis